MASSLSIKPFVGALSSDEPSRLDSLRHSDLCSAVLWVSMTRESRSRTLSTFLFRCDLCDR
ncbi:hypothetical protein HanOQP8_Chr15g0564591 [Helianthus annuus]|nr:hypothetical protein HanHA89_Chr15g0605641 [Helianthus annuus]KAJ0647911.1 hypothetical protein HanLR1_Chr15g0566961 [Helianthus annuus]KAJ0651767.1 hypothetical protein HanOQP8_Chr15g0564591 [Helianthus annuus]